jgi:hypothetical protein
MKVTLEAVIRCDCGYYLVAAVPDPVMELDCPGCGTGEEVRPVSSDGRPTYFSAAVEFSKDVGKLNSAVLCGNGDLFWGEWRGDKTGQMSCPECGDEFTATWPGWSLTYNREKRG